MFCKQYLKRCHIITHHERCSYNDTEPIPKSCKQNSPTFLWLRWTWPMKAENLASIQMKGSFRKQHIPAEFQLSHLEKQSYQESMTYLNVTTKLDDLCWHHAVCCPKSIHTKRVFLQGIFISKLRKHVLVEYIVISFYNQSTHVLSGGGTFIPPNPDLHS